MKARLLSLVLCLLASAAHAAPSDADIRRQREQFHKAHDLITTKDYAKAAALLEDNIRKYPDAPMDDYDRAWLLVCLAYLGRFQDIPTHYEIIQTQYFGDYSDPESRLMRNWSAKLGEVRQVLRASPKPDAARTLQRLEQIDQKREQAFVQQLPALIRKAKQNDAAAIRTLQSNSSTILELLVNGRLKLQTP